MNKISQAIIYITAAVLVCGAAVPSHAQKSHVNYRRASALPAATNTAPIMVEVSNPAGPAIDLTYSLPDAGVKATGQQYGNENLSEVTVGNALQRGNEGEPVLPVIPVQVVVPAGYSLVKVNVTTTRKKDVKGAFRIRHGEARFPLTPGAKPRTAVPLSRIYNSDNPYPSSIVEVVGVQYKRGVAIAVLKVHPVTYRPQSKRLTCYESISFKVQMKKGGPSSRLKARPNALDRASLKVENPEALDSYQEGQSAPLDGGSVSPLGMCNPAQSYQYVLVTADSFRTATNDYTVRDLIAQKQARGISATIVTIEDVLANYAGVDNAERLRNFIIDAYNNWETDFVLLGGDINIIPLRELYCTGGGETDQIPSDLYYQCLDGNYNSDNDGYWGEPTDGPGGGDVDLMAEVNIGRASAQTKAEMSNFVYKTLAYENAPESSPYLRKALMVGEYLGFGGVSDYATATMEEIRLGSSANGYTTAGFASSPLFSVDTMYDSPTFTWTASNLIGRMNNGTYSIYNHLGHANETYDMKLYNADADALTNTNFFFVYSQGCEPGAFDVDCFAEHLTTSTRNGAFAVVLNARYGWGQNNSTDGPSQRFDRQFWDAYFGEYLSNLGALNADSHEDNIWDINGDCIRWCLYETNLLGDPQTPIRGRVTGPSLAYNSHTMSDVAGGNGDGLVNPGETIDITLTIANVGTDSAAGVTATVSSTDPYVTMVNGSTTLGTIQCCGATRVAGSPVRLSVASNCPTPHTMTLSCLLRDSRDSTWTSTFAITAYTSSQVSGYVRTLTGGNPVPGATVSFSGPISGSVTTNSSGAYLFGGIDGTYSVTAVAAGYLQSSPVSMPLPPSQTNVNFNLARPHMNLTPASLRTTVQTGGATSSTVTLANSGDAALTYIIAARDLSAAAVLSAEALYPPDHFVELPKGAADKRIGKPVTLGSGGPDQFGYRWVDSDQPGGPAYQWNDIRSTGTLLSGLSCDDCYQSVSLSFGFPFYGNTFSTMYVGSNGYITFGSGSTAYSNYALPSTSMPANLIAAFFDDLYPASGGQIYFQDFGTSAVVQFTNVAPYSGSGSFTFQIVLEQDGTMYLYYNSLTGTLTSATAGIQNGAQNDGLTVVYNATYLKNNLAVRLRPAPAWLTVTPASGTVAPSGSTALTVQCSSNGLYGGLYNGALAFTHNDPTQTSPYQYPCTLEVDGIRRLSVSPSSLNFGSCWVGLRDTAVLTLTNSGDEATSVSSVTSTNACFSAITALPLAVPPFGSTTLRVVYQPASVGSHTGTLTVNSNAEDNPVIGIPCTGTGTYSPHIAVTPSSFSRTLNEGDSATGTLIIGNSGGDSLTYRITLGSQALASQLGERVTRFFLPEISNIFDSTSRTYLSIKKSCDSLPIVGTLADSMRILWDLTHGVYLSYQPSGDYSQLVQALAAKRISVYMTSSSVTSVNLSQYNAVVVALGSAWNSIYTAQEVAALQNYVTNGGGLIILGDNNGCPNANINPVSSAFGTTINPNGTCLNNITSLQNHPVFAGVNTIYFGCGGNLVVAPPATIIGSQSGLGAISAATVGLGKVLTIGDINVWDNSDLASSDNRTFALNVFNWVMGASSTWLSYSPAQGSIQPGLSANVAVKFSAKNLLAGLHSASLLISHNAPDTANPLTIPCSLSVIGFRSLSVSPSSLNFGSLWVGLRDTLLLTLKNPGNEATVVGSIASNNAEFAAVDPMPLTVGPFDSVRTRIVFFPISVGSKSGNLTITSNAEDNPSINVAVSGSGISAPRAATSPVSFSKALSGGDSVIDVLSIRNIGGDALTYAITTAVPMAGAQTNARAKVTSNGSDSTIENGLRLPPDFVMPKSNDRLVVNYPFYDGFESGNWNNWTAGSGSYTRTVTSATAASGTYSFTQTGGNSNHYDGVSAQFSTGQSPSEISFAVRTNSAGGASGYFVIDQGGTDPIFFFLSDQGVFYANQYTTLAYQANVWYRIRFHINWTAMNFDFYVDGSLVAGGIPFRGQLTSFTTIYLYNFYSAQAWWDDINIGNAPAFNWLTLSPTSGTVAPGETANIQVTFNSANMLGGTYASTIRIATNAPGQESVVVPCTLSVLGMKRLSVSPASLNFGTVLIGRDSLISLSLQNSGNDTTTVTAVTSSNGVFTHTAVLPLKVAPFGTSAFQVRYRPTRAGTDAGTLTIVNNAQDNPSIGVPLQGAAAAPASISVAPLTVIDTAPAGASKNRTLVISNNGGVPLQFSIVENAIDASATASPYGPEHFVALAKGQPDTRVGRPVPVGSGGPDSFGYRWKDSDDPNGPAYVWRDIKSIGTMMSTISACDDCFEAKTLSFVFPFYGNTFSTIYVSSNGFITFGAGSNQIANYPLPSASAPANLIDLFHDDLNPGSAGDVYFLDEGNKVTIQFDNVRAYDGSGYYTFQAVLKNDGTITIYYATLTGTLTGCTVGIQNATQTVGLTVVYNAAYLKNNLAVEIRQAPKWLSIAPNQGTVGPGSSLGATVTLNAAELMGGTYRGRLAITHNDPAQPNPLVVPCTLTVIGAIPDRSRIISIGASNNPKIAGALFTIKNLGVGSSIVGSAQGSRYSVRLR